MKLVVFKYGDDWIVFEELAKNTSVIHKRTKELEKAEEYALTWFKKRFDEWL
jgi:IS1 family transposase